MKGLLFILNKVGECGRIERHERNRLMEAYTPAWVAFAEAVGEPFTTTPDAVLVTAAQMSEVRARVEKAYALPLAVHRLKAALWQSMVDDYESARRFLHKLYS